MLSGMLRMLPGSFVFLDRTKLVKSCTERMILSTGRPAPRIPKLKRNVTSLSSTKQSNSFKNKKRITTASSRILLGAVANAADRVLKQLSWKVSRDGSGETDMKRSARSTVVLEGAQLLLEASKDPNTWKTISSTTKLDGRIHSQLNTIHQSFLAASTHCLNCLGNNSTENEKLLRAAVDLSNRGRQLGLPFHLPLYRKLVEALSASNPPLLDMIECVGSWASDTDHTLLRTALTIMIEKGQGHAAASLMMRRGRILMDEKTVSDLYLLIHDKTRVYYTTPGTLNWTSLMATVVSYLEPSVEKILRERDDTPSNLTQASLPTDGDKAIAKALEVLTAAIDTTAKSDVENEDDFEEDDYTDSEQEEDEDEKSTLEHVSKTIIKGFEDPFAGQKKRIHYLVTILLLRNIKNEEVADYFINLSGGVDSTLYNDVESLYDDVEAINDRSATHWEDHGWCLPDIKEQVSRLNQNRELSLTREFDDYLLERIEGADKKSDP